MNYSILKSIVLFCLLLKNAFFWNLYFSMKKCFISQKYFNKYLFPNLFETNLIFTYHFLIHDISMYRKQNALVKLWLSLRISCSWLYWYRKWRWHPQIKKRILLHLTNLDQNDFFVYIDEYLIFLFISKRWRRWWRTENIDTEYARSRHKLAL